MKNIFSLVLCLSLFSISGNIYSQSSADVEEVIVTATKKEKTLQDATRSMARKDVGRRSTARAMSGRVLTRRSKRTLSSKSASWRPPVPSFFRRSPRLPLRKRKRTRILRSASFSLRVSRCARRCRLHVSHLCVSSG